MKKGGFRHVPKGLVSKTTCFMSLYISKAILSATSDKGTKSFIYRYRTFIKIALLKFPSL